VSEEISWSAYIIVGFSRRILLQEFVSWFVSYSFFRT
jgi:hypothetical protein